ncbi:MAG TPA: carotenoid biosynthesis protein [candidate division WOR-3 bacterium]|uniref:Carotenoid biosynthesis protein n=1 Tax=candidate division WOR-3 bacterium TaxID=2052148 RepID=A0A7V0T5M7_UNCW3|nr:carotenoid biosynthesis protein [candidate division WOR-3 bacterium]
MQNETRHSPLLTWGARGIAVAAAGFMLADFIVRPTTVWLSLMPVYCLAAFALVHSFTFMKDTRQVAWFLFLGLVLPFIAEWLGTNFGAIFGSHYYARARELTVDVGIRLPGRVSLAAVLSWYAMLYLTFVTSTHLLRARSTKPSSFAAVPMTAGLMMMLWQFTAGPVAIYRGFARYAQEGLYHGLPISSFVGWFATPLFIVLFFLAIEPSSVDGARLAPARKENSLALAVFGATLGYPALLCFRFGMTGAAWLGLGMVMLYLLTLAIRARAPRPFARLSPVGTA